MLRAAAVAGASFSVGVVAQMLGVAVLALLDPVDECQAAAFLVAGDRPGDYRFSHALVRSAVVAQLPAADQRACRARLPSVRAVRLAGPGHTIGPGPPASEGKWAG